MMNLKKLKLNFTLGFQYLKHFDSGFGRKNRLATNILKFDNEKDNNSAQVELTNSRKTSNASWG
jgi:hypothetical protein